MVEPLPMMYPSIGTPEQVRRRQIENRDGVIWEVNKGVRTVSGKWVPLSTMRQCYEIWIDNQLSLRWTTNPIGFMANRDDHDIPKDALLEFIPIPMEE
jgi:hypothetical protein